LGGRLVVPEIGAGHAVLDCCYQRFFRSVVKDCLAVARFSRECVRRGQ
jgi:hypothetical protein